MNVKDVLQEHPIVAIVHFRVPKDESLYNGGHSPQNPACLLQVTLNLENLSPSKKLIRFGANGDEIVGWTKIEALEVVEVLGRTDGKTVIPIKDTVMGLGSYDHYDEESMGNGEWPPQWSVRKEA